MKASSESASPPADSANRQFHLKSVFVVIAFVAVAATLVGIAMRPRRDNVPEAWLLSAVDEVQPGMQFEEVTKTLDRLPSADWLKETGNGFAIWRFQVSDVAYADSRASFFVKFEGGVVESSFLLYPLESAGGGMVF